MLTETASTVSAPAPLPCFLGPPGAHLFAWHHVARADLRRDAVVVLCPPLGFEYTCVYRTWRILAQELAALGLDVLRFDYHGTGNSAGDPEDPGRLGAWLLSIERASVAARELAGTEHVALVGLRLGATLAVEAAARAGVSRLVLWSPFRSGRSYVRELLAFALLSSEDDLPPESEEAIQAAGHIFTRQTLDELERLEIDSLERCAVPEVLIVDRDDRPVDPVLGARLEASGVRVTRCRPEGTSAMLVQPALSTVPRLALDAIGNWLSTWFPSGTTRVDRRRSASSPCSVACGDGYRERAVQFGPRRRLFGVLTEPAAASPDAPAIVMCTTGAEHHVGPNRLYVPLARRWAARGHLVLRYDLGGIGDSLPPPGIGDNVAYPAHALEDAREAIAFARGKAPARKLILLGLCSGGWLAFRAALDGLPVDAIIAINPPLYLREGPAGMQCAADDSEFERYQRLFLDRASWSKVVRGRAAYGTFLRLSCGALARKVLAHVNTISGGRLNDGLGRELEIISARGIASLFVFSQGDRGLDYFRLYGGAARRGPRRLRGIHHVIVNGGGHMFRPLTTQRELCELLNEFVARQSSARRCRGRDQGDSEGQ
jgi:alpha-beta hydrolase superfamily lysophospholipase